MGTSPSVERFGRYVLLHRIAVGGMAEIYVAYDQEAVDENKLVVIKRIREDLCDDKTFIRMFLDEARVISRLSHPNIVKMHDFGHVDGRYFIALEFVWGESLANMLVLCDFRGIQFPVGAALYIGGETARALHYAHHHVAQSGHLSPVIHRDVTLGNVVVSYQGAVKLLDFGIAKARDRLSKTAVGNIKGTLAYLAPEQILQEDIGPHTDIYQLGVLLYKILVGREPFSPTNEAAVVTSIVEGRTIPPSSVIPGFPASVERLILTAMARKPAKRFANAGELRAAVLQLLGQHYALGKQGLVSMVARITEDRYQKQRRFVGDLLRGVGVEGMDKGLLDWAATASEPKKVNVELSVEDDLYDDAPVVDHAADTKVSEIPAGRPPAIMADADVPTKIVQPPGEHPSGEIDASTVVAPNEFEELSTVLDETDDAGSRTRIEEMAFPDVRTLLAEEPEQMLGEEPDARTSVDTRPEPDGSTVLTPQSAASREAAHRHSDGRDAAVREVAAREAAARAAAARQVAAREAALRERAAIEAVAHEVTIREEGSPSGVFASLPSQSAAETLVRPPVSSAFASPDGPSPDRVTATDVTGSDSAVSSAFAQPAGGGQTLVDGEGPIFTYPGGGGATLVTQPRSEQSQGRDPGGFAAEGPTLVLDEDQPTAVRSPDGMGFEDAPTISMAAMRPRRQPAPPPESASEKAEELDFDIDVDLDD